MSQDSASDHPSLQLHVFLRAEHEAILRDWERVDRASLSPARALATKELRNNVPTILDAIADQAERSLRAEGTAELPREGSRLHAEQRWRLGLSLEDVTREYGLLRAVILRKLVPRVGELPAGALVFLNHALDEAIVQGVMTYVASANRKLEDERERLQVTLRSIGDGVVSTDAHGHVTYMNPAAENMCGWSRDEAHGHPVSEVVVALDEETLAPTKSLTEVAATSGDLSRHAGEIVLRARDGALLPAEEVAAPLHDADGRFLGVVTTFRDVSSMRALTAELGYLATHDSLTGLPNRALLKDRLTQEVAHAERNGSRLALLYLDLDLFKDVNDTLGHAAGDELLKQVSVRLQGCVRRTDTVSRLGGDEFVVLLTEFASLAYLSELGAKIAERLSASYAIRADKVEISASVGISVFPEDGSDAETLMKHADTAMYHAKAHGRDNVQFFAAQMNKRALARRELQGDLRSAATHGQFRLHFQPQIALDSGVLVGAEALLRWRHPRLEWISPAQFIPIAEENREIMLSIGNWVLEEACRQASAWRDADLPALRISVNVSLVQLRHEGLLDHVDALLRRFGLPPEQLQLELTEAVLMSDSAGAQERVRALKKMGIGIAVDDFGLGCSCLSHLKALPVDELKIDQSFVQGMASDPDKAAIAHAVVAMGQNLGVRVIAEGVENQDTAKRLNAQGCAGAQGYFYSPAVAADEFARRFLALPA